MNSNWELQQAINTLQLKYSELSERAAAVDAMINALDKIKTEINKIHNKLYYESMDRSAFSERLDEFRTRLVPLEKHVEEHKRLSARLENIELRQKIMEEALVFNSEFCGRWWYA